MGVSAPINWLNELCDVKSIHPNDLSEKLTIAGLEVETVEEIGSSWQDDLIVIAQITKVEPHPDADKLSLVTLDTGKNKLVGVSGAPNLKSLEGLPQIDIKVPLALLGATFIDAYADKPKLVKLKASKIRGIKSECMICSELELGLSDNHEGVMILPSDAPIGASLKSYLGDHVLNFDVKGGFSHLLAIYGIARETAALYSKKLDDTPLTAKKRIEKAINSKISIVEQPNFAELKIEDKKLCSRYSVLLLKNIKIGPSPFWMQRKLGLCGMRPINNIVDITNYVMLELGQPLHAFDYDKLTKRAGNDKPLIEVRKAKSDEKMKTLDGIERKLDDQMLMIADSSSSLAVAGIMGGLESEVDSNTKTILLESANFEFLNNRRTSQVLKLRSEASERFGKRIDPELTLVAAFRAAELMIDYAEGNLENEVGDLYLDKKEVKTITLKKEQIYRLLGIHIESQRVVEILNSLEFGVTGTDSMEVTVPTHRMDINQPADLVEEIVRVYGYDNLPYSYLDEGLCDFESDKSINSVENIKNILCSNGLDEVISYSLTSFEDENIMAGGNLNEENFVTVKNPLSSEKKILRKNLSPNLLNFLEANLRKQDYAYLFEIGNVFLPVAGQQLPNEIKKLGIAMGGKTSTENWHNQRNLTDINYYHIKGVIEQLLSTLHINNVVFERGAEHQYHPGKSAVVKIKSNNAKGLELGQFGELNPKIHQHFGFEKNNIFLAEFDINALIKHSTDDFQMNEISIFTPIFEDLAFVVDKTIHADQIKDSILKGGGKLLKKVELFDVFEGEQVGANKKSLAFSLTYQSIEKTLKDKEIGKVRNKIIAVLKNDHNAELRG